jgi:hypothetical protein
MPAAAGKPPSPCHALALLAALLLQGSFDNWSVAVECNEGMVQNDHTSLAKCQPPLAHPQAC